VRQISGFAKVSGRLKQKDLPMKPLFSLFIVAAALGLAAGCSSKSAPKAKPSVQAKKAGQVRISHIKQEQGAQELMLHSMSLVGTPYNTAAAAAPPALIAAA
jgi:hypothetical protein